MSGQQVTEDGDLTSLAWQPPEQCHNGAVTLELEEARWPFSSARGAIDWWYRPVVEARTWVAFGYLTVGAVWGPLMFVAVIMVLVIMLPLILIIVGLVLVGPAHALIAAVVGVERRRASWVGASIRPRRGGVAMNDGAVGDPGIPFSSSARATGSNRSWLRGVTSRLGDSQLWREVAFSTAFLVAAPVLLVIGIIPWVVVARVILGYSLDPGSLEFIGLLVAVALAGAAPRIMIVVADVERSFVAWFLGPAESAELQERVDQLSAQREQILEAVASERQRIERNLHDGVQQQLVALGIDIGRAAARIESDPDGARVLLDDAREKVRGSIGELRVIGRGLHPAVLEDRGLDAALSSVVANSSIPISVEVTVDRPLPDDAAATAYYVVNEAVANILKHAKARVGSVRVDDDPVVANAIRITVHDDGRGGAELGGGSGLSGTRARIEAVDGRFTIDSPIGGPTSLVAVIPIGDSSVVAP